MGTKKVYITLIVIIFVFFIVMFLVFGLDNLLDGRKNTTLIVGDTTWVYKNQRWYSPTNYKDFDWQKYTVYVDNQKMGNYYLTHSDKWYVFDNKKNAINIDGNLIAYKANHDISIYDFEEEDIDDYSYVSEYLDNNGIKDNNFTSAYKISFDYDNDGVVETFYVVSNVFLMESTPDTIFSIVFMEKNNKIYDIYENIGAGSIYDGCKPYIKAFIDVNNDKKYEFVLSCAGYSVSNTVDMLYQYKDKEFKIVISNQ